MKQLLVAIFVLGSALLIPASAGAGETKSDKKDSDRELVTASSETKKKPSKQNAHYNLGCSS